MDGSIFCKTLSLFFACVLVAGCEHVKVASSQPASERIQIRNNCVSLLYDLLNDEKHVGKLLLIKRDRKELHDLIKRISAASAAGAARLEEFAKRDPTIELRAMALPPGEQAVRKAISRAKEKELLAASGADFEFKLLLSQSGASNYAAHLARVAADNSSDPDQSRELAALSAEMHRLHDEIIALVRSGRH